MVAAKAFGKVVELGNLFTGDTVAFEFTAFSLEDFDDCAIQLTILIAASNSATRLQRKTYNFVGSGRPTIRTATRGDGVMIIQVRDFSEVCAVVTDFEVD